jgi:hypothetical protein
MLLCSEANRLAVGSEKGWLAQAAKGVPGEHRGSLAEGGFNTMRLLQLNVNADVWLGRWQLID